MSNRVLIGLVAASLAAMIVVASPSKPEPQGSVYGFNVRVVPDSELADFVRCGLSVFELETEELVAELPSLTIHAGGSNSLVFNGVDGVEVTLECSVDAEKTEASYEIEGTRDGQLVLNHLATIRLQ